MEQDYMTIQRFLYIKYLYLLLFFIFIPIIGVGDQINEAPKILTGMPSFSKQIIDTTMTETHFAIPGDFDLDGDTDVVATNYIDDMVAWYENNGSNGFTKHVIDSNLDGAYPVHVADLNRDGALDVLAAGYLADSFVWYENNGTGGFTRKIIDANANGAHSVFTVDIDRDGDIDVLTSSQDANTIVWYENDGLSNFIPHIIDNNAIGAKYAFAADLDGDNDIDIARASFFDKTVAWYENDGMQNFNEITIDSQTDGAYFVLGADLDGDIDLDLVSASQNDNTIAWYENNGIGVFTKRVIDRNAAGARAVYAYDADNDGDIDIFSASVNDDTIAWYRNDGRGIFIKQQIDITAGGAYGVSTANMNGDGQIDVISASRDDYIISLYYQVRYHKASLTRGSTLLINSDLLHSIDVDNIPSELIYNVSDIPNFGQLKLNGITLSKYSTFTQADINNNSVSYIHDGGNAKNDSFNFMIIDGGQNGVKPGRGTFKLNIDVAPLTEIRSDDFNTSTLNQSLWTFINPLNDAVLNMTGTQASIIVPAGTSHDIWYSNLAPRIMQNVSNMDFDVEVKFESIMNLQYQTQGLIVQQDVNNFLRFDFVRDSVNTRIFAARFKDGSPSVMSDRVIPHGSPLYIRINRQGDQWTQFYSYDGEVYMNAAIFSHSLTTNSIGVYAANHGIPGSSSPGFTGMIDYFFNTASPIISQDGLIHDPFINKQPLDRKIEMGMTATFNVVVTGTEPFSYQWQKNGIVIPGAINSSYTTPPTTILDNGSTYRVNVTNPVGSIMSNSSKLMISLILAPTIITQPSDQTIPTGQNATFSIVVTGTSPLSYQWQKNGTDIPGATRSSYTIAPTNLSDNGSTYRVNITNSAGSVMSNQATLTVKKILAPLSDDFSASSLDTSLWTLINPKGDATITLIGNGTRDAMLSIAIPGGQEHDVWIGNYAPRVMQSVSNTNFEIDLKFQSQLTSAYQMQGVIIQQDNYNYLRFDFVRFSTTTNVFAASFSNGLPTSRYNAAISSGNPLYLRVNRSGDLLKQFYSYDGINWITAANFNHLLNVSSVGPFAGNALGVSSPAFTGLVDYFFESSSYIMPEDGENIIDPFISIQPLNQEVVEGNVATFNVTAIGTAPFSYQWQRNGTNIPGATNSSYTTSVTTLLDNGSTYRVNITNPAGSILSNSATLTVKNFTNLIKNGGFESGRINWTFSPSRAGTFSITSPGYEGNNTSRLVFSGSGSNIQMYQAGIALEPNTRYKLSFAAYSNTGHDVAVRLIKHVSPYTPYSQEFVFNLSVSWQKFTTEFNTTGFTNIVNDGRFQFLFSPYVIANDIYFFDDIRLEKTSNQDLPTIITQPSNQTVTVGQNVTFIVVANGTTPLSYQWQKNGTNIPGATNAFYTTPLTTLSDNGSNYRVNVSNPAGSLLSNSATLTVISSITPPAITSQPSNQTVLAGQNATFIVVANGTTPLSYQWQKNGTNIPGATNAFYTTPLTTLSDNGSNYRVNVSNPAGSVMSDQAKLIIKPSFTLLSDDFNSMALNTSLWTVVNPKGDATITIIGNGTRNAMLSISVPGGQEHDVWAGNNAPRIMQSVENTDFEIELKFQSQLTSSYQLHGLIIQQDSNNYIRFDFVRFPTTTNVFAASFNAASPTTQYNVPITGGNPIFMKINRTGDLWKQSYSYDGSNWINAANFNYPMIVSSIGPFAGNAFGSSSPAFIGLFDYIFDTSSPIVPEDGGNLNDLIISMQPQKQEVEVGNMATFNVVATGTAPISYQWLKNGIIIPGATNESYTTPITTLNDNGSNYRVNITNPYGSVMSDQALLSVRMPLKIISDDFNSQSLNTSLWTIINPKNDSQFIISGNGTSNAVLSIALPAGISHDAWIGVNNAPRTMQSVSNTDFEIELKFQSLMTSQYQLQGVIIQQDANNYLRFDFVRNSATTNIFAASIIAGSPTVKYDVGITSRTPLFLRVNRTGNQWKQFYSYNGLNWISAANFNHSLNVTSLGPFVGNSALLESNSPAFTGIIDYFINTSSPIIPEDVPDNTSPINLWYGNTQNFGQIGVPQQWVNILGNVHSEYGIATLNYSLNNGSVSELSMGPESYRLVSLGDFNIEINRTDLLCGNNRVAINATYNAWNTRMEIVTLNYSCNNVWPRNYNINWSNVSKIQDVVQIVDGLWTKETNSIHPAIIGYDRLINIGDITWDDYEITVPITLNAPLDPSAPHGGPNFGVGMRWQGHYDSSKNQQPREGWYPLGALGVYIWVPEINDFRLRIIGNGMYVIANDNTGKHLNVGVPYFFKMRAETIGTQTLYSLKVWERNTNEPTAWTISGYGPSGELKLGSVLLNNHYANVSYGNVSIRSGPFGNELSISDVSVNTNTNSATINWITNKQASSNVSYGLNTSYGNGSVSNGMMVLSHTILLENLQSGTNYHYKIRSTDINGYSSSTEDMNFTTMSLANVSSIISDDFNNPALNTSIWKVVNPKGDAVVSIIGNGTENALLSINIPQGVEHDVWNGNNAPRIMQSVSNTNFEVELKFQSLPTLPYQIQGIIIQQDSNNFIRFDFVKFPTETKIFAASFFNGIPTARYNVPITSGNPMYLRVNRTVNQWKQYYSYDGTNWIAAANFNYPLIVTSIGPFAGNAFGNTSPAFISLVDYFFNTYSPIVPEDGNVSST